MDENIKESSDSGGTKDVRGGSGRTASDLHAAITNLPFASGASWVPDCMTPNERNGYENGYRDALQAAAELVLAASPSAPADKAEPVASEREAFNAWVQDCGCDTDGAWSAWMARAALAVTAVQPVRMLTEDEFDAVNRICRHPGDWMARAIHKFCEVNGLTIKEDKHHG